jgi:spermidine synthase
VPAFGDWGFVLAGRGKIAPENLKVSVPTRFLDSGIIRTLFRFGKDEMPSGPLEINRLDRPVLYRYYKKGWTRFNQ